MDKVSILEYKDVVGGFMYSEEDDTIVCFALNLIKGIYCCDASTLEEVQEIFKNDVDDEFYDCCFNKDNLQSIDIEQEKLNMIKILEDE